MKLPLATALSALLLASPALAQTYTYTDSSAIKFTAYAPMRWNGVHGVCHVLKGKIEVPNGKLEDAIAGIGIPIAAFEAKEGMDQHTFTSVEAAKFPSVMFRSKKIQITGRTPSPDGTHLSGTVSGILNFHGVERPITVPFTAVDGPEQASIDTEFWIKLSDYALDSPSILIIKIFDDVKIDVHLVATRDPEKPTPSR